MTTSTARIRTGVSTIWIAVVVVVIVLLAGGAFYMGTITAPRPSSSTTTSTIISTVTSTTTSTTTSTLPTFTSTTSTSTSTTAPTPTSYTYETTYDYSYLDPEATYSGVDWGIFNNIYEPLLWYNGSSTTQVIPWLASGYTASPDLRTYNFTLRQGIQFADGEQFNSSAVYFSLNRFLILDGSDPTSHGSEASWILQQLENTSLSTTISGISQTYNAKYVNSVLAENFVQITGPYTFTMHVEHPDSSFPYLISGVYAGIIAPGYVIQHDLALWNQPSAGYTLPYPHPSGSAIQEINQYFMDEVATCNAGITPNGCGTTYLGGSTAGSLAGTGPYTVSSADKSTGSLVLKANPTYWGGALREKIVPRIQTIYINYVPDLTTAELDLRTAAASGKAMSIDLPNSNLYDIANRVAWLQNRTLISTVPGVSIYGPAVHLATAFEGFSMNVTNPLTGAYEKFQPFADQRFRLAFSDAVNMTQINQVYNNGVGRIALNSMPPGMPPLGVYNTSVKPVYSFNPDEVQSLLLDAMQHPITTFHFVNGTLAPPGFFDNTFGCTVLTKGACTNPVPQTIGLSYYTGATLDEGVLSQIAQVVNNVSATYNMGLTVTVTPMSVSQLITEMSGVHVYMYGMSWGIDYPWVLDFTLPFYAPGGFFPGDSGWNIPYLGHLYQQAANASAHGNIPGLIKAEDQLDTWGNQHVMYLWTYDVAQVYVMTSNVHGYYWNAADHVGFADPYYAELY